MGKHAVVDGEYSTMEMIQMLGFERTRKLEVPREVLREVVVELETSAMDVPSRWSGIKIQLMSLCRVPRWIKDWKK